MTEGNLTPWDFLRSHEVSLLTLAGREVLCDTGQESVSFFCLTAAEAHERLLKATEVAEMLGIGRTKVYEMLRSRDLPVIYIGTSPRVRFSDLRRWVDERINRSAEEEAA